MKHHAQSWRRDLNPRPADYKSAALPTELRQQQSPITLQPLIIRNKYEIVKLFGEFVELLYTTARQETE